MILKNNTNQNSKKNSIEDVEVFKKLAGKKLLNILFDGLKKKEVQNKINNF